MNARRALPLLALLLAAGIAAALAEAAAGDGSVVELDAILPPYETKEEDEYLCTAVQLPDRPMKLISVESLSEQATVHHMLLFGERRCLADHHAHAPIAIQTFTMHCSLLQAARSRRSTSRSGGVGCRRRAAPAAST